MLAGPFLSGCTSYLSSSLRCLIYHQPGYCPGNTPTENERKWTRLAKSEARTHRLAATSGFDSAPPTPKHPCRQSLYKPNHPSKTSTSCIIVFTTTYHHPPVPCTQPAIFSANHEANTTASNPSPTIHQSPPSPPPPPLLTTGTLNSPSHVAPPPGRRNQWRPNPPRTTPHNLVGTRYRAAQGRHNRRNHRRVGADGRSVVYHSELSRSLPQKTPQVRQGQDTG